VRARFGSLASLSVALFAAEASTLALAQDKPLQPYIDELRSTLPEKKSESGESYIDQERRKLKDAESSEGYSEKRRLEILERESSESYSEKERRALPAKETGGAIQALQEGRSELKMRRPGEIRHGIGFRMAATANYDITGGAGVQARNFNDVYGAKFAPNFAFTYEYQPFHSEVLGNLGLVANGGLSYFSGNGTFSYSIPDFDLTSRTNFNFWLLPASVGVNYRFNLLKYIRPFVFAGPGVVGYIESRNDGRSANRGYSFTLNFSGGIAILMDWMSSESAWNYYDSFSIKHTYLTVEYQQVTPLSGAVSFANSGIFAGLLFEL
jgi:hypothetical protein